MPFADELVGADVARDLARVFEGATGAPPHAVRAAAARLGPLGLRQRCDLLRDALLADVPGDTAALLAAVRAARTSPGFAGWLVWPVTEAVVSRAVAEGTGTAFDAALDSLAELTPLLSSEFALRGLLEQDLHRALGRIREWTASPDEHVRRLASEGTRPYLPWAKRVRALLAEPTATVPIIDALHGDTSDYVRRSAANHLNDLSRDHPELVVQTAARWLGEPGEHTSRVARHGLRTLVKQGHPEALALLGYSPAPQVRVGELALDAGSVAIGGALEFRSTLVNTGAEPVALAVDYLVHHRKANGGRTAKTFKLTTRTLEPGGTWELAKRHSFREITTRRYHPGGHAVELQVNGVVRARAEFTLTAAR
ncbi:DNA alkylation repair protein [Saccharopolyspora sp. 6V]|uniref:DNA alkylation repair protein n=1 Tax=Saccharopolyspora sp. 6V TaxID=2877239 RepID=UPI001CD3F00E|nr:DNA alkylation repair protein [Saccharopolyspora sp. 6V]MCA1193031.1 DNA alkylation repair protein [Saccharopolyspora sp. 6V]